MREPGDLAYERGDDEEAARLYRLGAEREGEHGSVSAAFNLGCLLRNCERPSTAAEAKQWLESAARRGHRGAMAALGRLLKENEDAEGAESWFRAAGKVAWFDLGFLLLDQKQTEAAERCYRLAAEAGDPGGIYNLAVLLHERGDVAEAERWYETAAAQGDRDAMFGLGVLRKERGDYDGADDWYLRADELGHREATVNLGFSARFRGDLAAAERWFLRAVNEGNKQVLCSLGIVMQEQGRLDEAERWYRGASAAVGMSSGQDNLRALQRRRRYPDAQCFFHHDTREALWLSRRATGKLERGDRWRRLPAAWTPSAVPVGGPGAPPFRIDLTGLEAFDSGDLNFPWAWFEPRTGNATLMNRSGLAMELPEPHELDDWRRIFAQNRASNEGCLLEMDIRRLGGRAALYQLWKQRQSRNERGFVFFAVYVVPSSGGIAGLQYQASEGGTTGVRETLVVVKLGIPKKLGIPHPYDPDLTGGLPYLRADEPAWDEMFPDHPLSQARAWSRLMERTAVLEDE
jgi:TPR repeat protein